MTMVLVPKKDVEHVIGRPLPPPGGRLQWRSPVFDESELVGEATITQMGDGGLEFQVVERPIAGGDADMVVELAGLLTPAGIEFRLPEDTVLDRLAAVREAVSQFDLVEGA